MCKDYVLIKGYPGTGMTRKLLSFVQFLYNLLMNMLKYKAQSVV